MVNHRQTDRMFAWLVLIQWVAGIAAALWISPKAWAGQFSHIHIHVWAAIFLGGLISFLPVFLAIKRPGEILTRHVIAVGQMLSCGLFIHLSGGRIEAHFQYFGTLAFLAFYRDWKVLLTATMVATTDHFVRGWFWPQSMFGVLAPAGWRWLEHVGWILFEAVFLMLAVRQNLREILGVAERQAKLETINETIEHKVDERTVELQLEIAERVKIEAALQRQQTELRALFDLMPAMVWFKDPENRILRINKKAAELAGKPVEAIEGKLSQEIYPQEAAKFYTDDLEVIQSGMPRLRIIESVQDSKGDKFWIQTDKVPYYDKDGKIVGVAVMALDITRRTQDEELLRLLGSAVEQSKESIVITDAELTPPGPRIIFANPAFTIMTGYTAEEIIGQTPRILQGPGSDKAVLRRLRQNLEQGEPFAGEVVNYRKDGKEFNLEWQVAPLRNAGGNITHFVAIQRDITERKQLEARMLQSQKMETVGKLAGGIAHEFNSILTAIIGQCELLLNDLPSGSPLTISATEISRAAGRAATLTRQLLAYGRKQFLQPEPLDLNEVVVGMESMFHNLLGSGIEVLVISAPGLHSVKADSGQIEQVIINMAMNANDAMPGGGKLMLETANVSLDEKYVSCFPESEIKAGEYVMLAITDTGTGMITEVKERIFEPFFSTKGVGQGTGLGLSTCYGIVKQSDGHISVYSEPGRGTTFKIYLPQVEAPKKISVLHLDVPALPRGTETILLVEDDPALRGMEATLLRRLGYHVLAAANGIEALGLKHKPGTGHVDLLFTDFVMPHMNGVELADRMRMLYPHTRVLFTSAYSENTIVHQGIMDKGVALLQKPFTPSALANKIREILDQSAAVRADSIQETFRFTNPILEAKPASN